jgi:hypothetical protein
MLLTRADGLLCLQAIALLFFFPPCTFKYLNWLTYPPRRNCHYLNQVSLISDLELVYCVYCFPFYDCSAQCNLTAGCNSNTATELLPSSQQPFFSSSEPDAWQVQLTANLSDVAVKFTVFILADNCFLSHCAIILLHIWVVGWVGWFSKMHELTGSGNR